MWSRNEYLYDNIIEEDFRKILLPLNLLHLIYFHPKYRFTNNFITPNGNVSSLISIFGTILFIFSHFYTFSKDESVVFELHNGFLSFSPVFKLVTYCVSFVICFAVHTKHSLNHVLLVLKLQDAHKKIKFQVIKMNKFKIWYWFCIYLLFPILIGIYLTYYFSNFNLDLIVRIVYLFSVAYFDIFVIDGYMMMKLLNCEMSLCNTEMKHYSKMCSEIRDLRILYEETHWEVIFQTYSSIIQAYNIYKSVYQFHILLLALTTFMHSMLYVQMFIEFGKMGIIGNFTVQGIFVQSLAATWLMKNLTLLRLLSSQCVHFYELIGMAASACCAVLHKDPSDEAKRACKKILRINWTTQKMTVYGFFYTDGLAIKVWRLVSRYIIVLLQFALEKRSGV